jgi:hypothetical protein
MNNAIIATLISVLYLILKYMYSRESPNFKEGLFVFFSSLGGLYASEQFGPPKPKTTEVFTENPSF